LSWSCKYRGPKQLAGLRKEISMSFPTSATSVSAYGKSGGTCNVTGPYRSSSTVLVFFKRGDKFPVDPVTRKATIWTLSASAVSIGSSTAV
jgi:hypothetical protein